MKWFIALNSGADLWFRDMVKVAVSTAKKYTPLEPHCIYDGEDTPLSRWMEANGVTLHRFRVPFYDRLFSDEVLAANKGSAFNPINASGIYLKLFINEFCEPNERFLFTDCDIMFTEHFDIHSIDSQLGEFKAVIERGTPPQGLTKGPVFNSGVFATDESVFRAFRGQFLQILEERKYYFWGKPGFFDQGLLNIVFANVWNPMDARLNWRPFWGLAAKPMIWHYHGAKPLQIKRILEGKPDRVDNPDIIKMVNDNRPAYEDLLRQFNNELSGTEPLGVTNPSTEQTVTSTPVLMPVAASPIDAKIPSEKSLAELCSFPLGDSIVSAKGTYGEDYLRQFKQIFELYSPTEILEWGAGTTTLLMAHLVDREKTRIVTIDDNETYLRAACAAVPQDVNIEAYACSRMGLGRGQSDPEYHYSSFPATLGRQFDFIYIDGRRRVECGVHALLCCTPNARIVVHDFRRARYSALLSLFDVVDETSQFRVFTPNPAILRAVRNRKAASGIAMPSLIDGTAVKKVR